MSDASDALAETRRIADAIRQQVLDAERKGGVIVGRTHVGRLASGPVGERAKEVPPCPSP